MKPLLPLKRRLAAALLLPFCMAAGAADLVVGGTGNALGAMRLLGEAFTKVNPGTRVVVLTSLGSSGAIKAVPAGAVDIGLASRPVTEDEAKVGIRSFEYARTPLVFTVATKSTVKALTLAEAADLFSGKTPSWPDGRQVRPILRQSNDENTRQMRRMSPALDQALTIAEARPGMPFATTDQEGADKLESIPGAFGSTALALIITEKRELRALALDGVEPTVANGASGKYPHAKHFYLVTRNEPSAGARQFIAYMQSAPGREILARSGHWIP